MASKYTALGDAVDLLVNTAELASLANATIFAKASAIDNDTASTTRDPMCVLELIVGTQGTARVAGAVVEVFFLPTLDGTNHSSAVAGCIEANLVAIFPLDAATTARTLVRSGIPLPPTDFIPAVRNTTGQAFGASGNSLKMRRYSVENV